MSSCAVCAGVCQTEQVPVAAECVCSYSSVLSAHCSRSSGLLSLTLLTSIFHLLLNNSVLMSLIFSSWLVCQMWGNVLFHSVKLPGSVFRPLQVSIFTLCFSCCI